VRRRGGGDERDEVSDTSSRHLGGDERDEVFDTSSRHVVETPDELSDVGGDVRPVAM
jgi:hypothetical protein